MVVDANTQLSEVLRQWIEMHDNPPEDEWEKGYHAAVKDAAKLLAGEPIEATHTEDD